MRSPGCSCSSAWISGRRGVDEARGVFHRRRLEELRRVGVGGDQTLDLRAQDRVAGARAIERLGARRRVELQHVVEDRLDAGPFLRREGVRHAALQSGRILRCLEQERARLAPLALDLVRLGRQRFGGLLDRQPGEEPQLDDAREALAEGFEARQGGVERHQFARALFVGDVDAVERDLVHAAAALLPRRPARVVDDDLPHRLGGDGEEVAAVRPVGPGAVDQLQVGLVHEHRGIERLPGPGAGELTPGGGVELGVDEAEDDVDRVAGRPRGPRRGAG